MKKFFFVSIVLAYLAFGNCASIEKDGQKRNARSAVDVDDYLEKYGYLAKSDHTDSSRGGVGHDDASRSQGIREFQLFNGLEVTGEMNKETYNKMLQPRCGVKDIPDTPSNILGPQEYNAPGRKWRKGVVTWRLRSSEGSRKLPENKQKEAIENALGYWSEQTPLQFQETSGTPDMEIKFARRNHGDLYKFDGEGGVLAHAYFPENGYLDGDTHFDEDERWVYHSNSGTEIETVAAHEFGHALGLGHSNNPSALMAPYYRGYLPNMKLHSDDVEGIQSLYGGPRNIPVETPRPTTKSTTTTPKPTTTTTTTTTPRPTTTKSTTTTTTRSTTTGNMCDIQRIDAMCLGPDGKTYVFVDNMVYKVGSKGLENGYPRPLNEVYSGSIDGPQSVKAAVYIKATNHTLLFSKTEPRIYRYEGFYLDRVSKTNDEHYQSALTMTNMYGRQQIYMFSSLYFWELNRYTLRVARGFPLLISHYWPRFPRNAVAAMEGSDGFLYVINRNKKYTRIDPYRRSVVRGYPGSEAAKWLSNLCVTPHL